MGLDGWAGAIMINESTTTVCNWCESMGMRQDRDYWDYNVSLYDHDLCELYVRTEKDFVLAKLRWA